jgi:predicted oxidoreductase
MAQNKLIYGCMGLGGSWDNLPLTLEDEKFAFKVLDTALNAGITHFDHADIYTFGKAEEVFGRFLAKNNALRDKIFIQSKTGIELHAGALNSNRYNLSKEYIISQVDKILGRLKCDYLDALLLHRPDPLTSMKDLSETLKFLKAKGKVLSFGVSNMSVSQIQLLQFYLDDPLITNQIKFSLAHSTLLDLEVWVNRKESPTEAGLNNLLAYSQKNNLSIQAYSPLAQGLYSESKTHERDEKTIKTIAYINQLAEKYQTGTSGILLAWLWRIPANIQAIIGTTNLDRIKQSANSTEIELTNEEWYNLWIYSGGVRLP